MTSTIETPGAFDALEKAKPDEPIFPLLAHDPCAPGAITEWCRLRRNWALKIWGADDASAADKVRLAAELAQCANAEAIALQMTDWASEHAEVEGQRSSYQELARSVEEVAEAERRKRRDSAVRHLREAAYHYCEARDLLVDLGLVEAEENPMTTILDLINKAADHFETKRPGHDPEPTLALGTV